MGQTLCTFQVGTMELALPATQVEEATRHLSITAVPLAPAGVRGLAHVRGRILPVISLRALLGLGGAPDGAGGTFLITRTVAGAAGLEVDRILDVVEADPSRYMAPPETLEAALRRCLAAALTLPDRVLLILELERLLGPEQDDGAGQPAERQTEHAAPAARVPAPVPA